MELKFYPDPSLKTVCRFVNFDGQEFSNEELLSISNDMLKIMYENNGVGLSANQVGLDLRMMVVDVSKSANRPIRMVNPIITKRVGEVRLKEGCLSFPNVFVDHKRSESCTIGYLDPLDGLSKQIDCVGILAVCVQHEVNHLNGITMIDGISQLKKDRALKQLRKKSI